MKCLSIRQPWAWLIVNGFKNIENRDWRTNFRGPLLIHASKGCTKDEYEMAVWFAQKIDKNINIPPLKQIDRGGIVGVVRLIDCVSRSSSPWFQGRYGFVLDRQKPVSEMIEVKGQLGIFEIVIEKTDLAVCDACGFPIFSDQQNIGYECNLHEWCA